MITGYSLTNELFNKLTSCKKNKHNKTHILSNIMALT